MIKHLYTLSLALLVGTVSLQAQSNVPNGVTGPAAATARSLPPVYFKAPLQYLRTYSPFKPITDTSQVNLSAVPGDVGILTKYFDSYGRVLQTVGRQASPARNDYVAPGNFDEFGNVSVTYLPFVSQSGNSNDGKFKLNPFYQDSAYYKGMLPGEQINYGQLSYDASPLNITVKATAPGNSWTGIGLGIGYSHRTNTTADSVHLWTIAISTEDDVPSTTTNYQAGSLTVIIMVDERGDSSMKYIDPLGRTVLTKSQILASPSTGHYGWLCTYYVYDEMDHLRLVIPPKAVAALNNTAVNWNLVTNSVINTGLCYGYFYDSRGRVTMRRIPGKGKIYLAYDLLDRVVLTQDPNLRTSSQWAFIIYDGQSRPVKTGLITSSLVKDTILAQAARTSTYPVLTGTYTVNTETYYDDYGWIVATGAPVSSSLVTNNINSTNFNTSYNSSPDYPQPIAVSNRIRGAVTGTKTIVLNTSTYLYSISLYDDHGRNIQTSQTNYSGGTDVATVQYGFSGRVLRTHLAHQKSGNNAQNHTLLTKYSYDHMGRVLSLTKNLDNTTDKAISQNTYNELGQLQTKVFGNSIETQTYSYNIRGWLLGINSTYANTAGSTANYFGESIYYDYGFTNNQLNGNIAGSNWKAAGDGIARAYGFTYDKVNRLTVADFSQQNQGSSLWTNDKVDYSVNGLTYDAGGNILSLRQRGLKLGSSATIDSLNYQYFSNSNQLQNVTDGITDMSPLGDFKDTTVSGNDYTYDANGNTTTDLNRHLCASSGGPGAAYNFLNKPDSIGINGRAGIHYYYDASGNQIFKQINDRTSGANPTVKNFLYISGFVYLNDTLQYILQEEGRIRYARKVNSTTGAIYYAYEYDYFIKDHLSNVRAVLTEGRDTSTYAATMETKDSAVVAALFSNVYTPVNTVYPKPVAFDTDTSNHYVARLNASSSVNIPAGPSLVLKVMAGDQLQISTYAYYTTPVQAPPSGVNLLGSILPLLAGGVVSNSEGKMLSSDLTNLSNALNPNMSQFLNNRSYDTTKPKAYLNWILFDDQFNYVASNSGVQQVLPGSSKQTLSAPLQTMSKNGYLYVYVSNESAQDVFFDNLTVKYYTGPLSQEQSYYPFGLQMAGISDRALLKQTNPYKYNGGVEFEEDYGVSYYNTMFRKYDPQIGRFAGVDMLSERSTGVSPYHFAGNDPVYFNDPSGAYDNKPGGSAPDYSYFWDAVLDAFYGWVQEGGGGGGGGGDGAGDTGGSGGAAFGASFSQNSNKSWSSRAFGSALDAFATGADQAFGSGYWGGGQDAVNGFMQAQQAYKGPMSDDIKGLSAPIFIVGHFRNSAWVTTNWNDVMRQIRSLGGGIGAMFEGEGKEEKPFFGSTNTNKFTQEHEIFNSWFFGSLSRSRYSGNVAGKEGIVTTDVSTSNGKIEGAMITIGFLELGVSSDISVSVGISAFGHEGHFGLGVGNGFGQISIGGSYTNNGGIVGQDVTYKGGIGTLLLIPVVAAAPVLAF